MVKIEFYISETDFDRIMKIKEARNRDEQTAEAFARELLEERIYSLYDKMHKHAEQV